MAKTTPEIAAALEEWAVETADDDLTSFVSAPEELTSSLPIVIAEVKDDRVREEERDLSAQQYQQVHIRVWIVELVFLVLPDPVATASQKLYDYVDACSDALRKDRTLGDRVEVASPFYDASYDPPEVEHPDGTVARMATFRITVGEQVEV